MNEMPSDPSINLWVENYEMRPSRQVFLPGPGRTANVVASIRGAKGWTVEVVQNGMSEAMHPPRYIIMNEYCATFPRILHTSGTIQIKCTANDGRSVMSEPIRLLLESGVCLSPQDE